ncbi:MAG: LpxL/LpxP family acyltransferase [Promethearchaeota archaeon]
MARKESSKVKKADSWGKQLNPIFNFTAWIHKYRIYRIWKLFPALNVKIYGRLFGTIYLHYIQRAYNKIIPSLSALFPNKSVKYLKKIYRANIAFIGQFLVQTIFRTSKISPNYAKKMITIKNLELIDKALEKGKGVIVASLHIGNFIEAMIGGLVYDDKRYKVSAVASLSNMQLFNEILKRPIARDFILIGTGKYTNVKETLLDQLKKNHIVVIMYDYTRETQFRVPFWHGRYPYLQHTPQSVASMHRKTGAPILLIITHPVGEIGRSLVEITENKAINEVSRRYKDAPAKEFHGRLSTEINKQINRYLRVYPHLWEEITNFRRFRIADKVQFKSGIEIYDFLNQILDKMNSIINDSYEPDRKDEEILNAINETFPNILSALKKPHEILRNHKTKIDLSLLNGISELKKLCSVVVKEMKSKNETEVAEFMIDLSKKIQ